MLTSCVYSVPRGPTPAARRSALRAALRPRAPLALSIRSTFAYFPLIVVSAMPSMKLASAE